MELPIFQRNEACTRCDLSTSGCVSVCIPTHLLFECTSRSDQAVLIIGEAPGAAEDERCLNFCGESGRKLDEFYIHGPGLPEYADVYVGNAVKCRPPQNADPTKSQLRACRDYLLDDLSRLAAHYRRVAVLCVGRFGLHTLTGIGISEWQSRQATSLSECDEAFAHLGNVHVFATYHPAFLLRDPVRENNVIPVLQGLAEWLDTGKITQEEMPRVEIATPVPPNFRGPLSYDLETEGCMTTKRQTLFHPRRIHRQNKVGRDEIIVVAGITWRDEKGTIRCSVFRWCDKTERARFLEWLRTTTRNGGELWGQHLQYDNKCVRYCHDEGRAVIPAWSPLRDLLKETFLYDDTSERYLGAVAWLYRIANFGERDKGLGTFSDAHDPHLAYTVCRDAWVTYRGIEVARQWQRDKYGAHPVARDKLSERCDRHYSDQFWAATLMEECGVAYDIEKLRGVHTSISAQFAAIETQLRALGLVIAGPGSDKSQAEMFARATADAVTIAEDVYGADSDEAQHARDVVSNLALTDTTNELSVAADNRNQVAGLFPLSDERGQRWSQLFALWGEGESLFKVLTSYSSPMLNGKKLALSYAQKRITVGKAPRPRKDGKGWTKSTLRWKLVNDKSRPIQHYDVAYALLRERLPDGRIVGMAYPTWHTLPKAKDKSGKGGGVRQFRWSAKDPALQTQTDEIFECITTRFRGGKVGKLDLAQMEWRTTAFMSRDAVMLREIADDVDIHSRTAAELMGWQGLTPDELLAWSRSPDGRRILCAAPDINVRQSARQWYAEGCTDSTWLTAKKHKHGACAWLRQEMGKSQNFAENYGGMPQVIQATCRVKAGIEVPLYRVDDWWKRMQARYAGRTAWREELLESVCRDYALHLPYLGQSRTFGGTERQIRGLYRPQILDFPVQCIASNILIIGLIETMRELHRRRMRAKIVLNIHDAVVWDSPADEYDEVQRILIDRLRTNWYIRELEQAKQMTFPLGYECEVVAEHGA